MIFVFECGCELVANSTKNFKKGTITSHGHKCSICEEHGEKLSHKIIKCKICGKLEATDFKKRRDFCEECFAKKFPSRARQLAIKKEKTVDISRICTADNCEEPIAEGNRFLCEKCYKNSNSEDYVYRINSAMTNTTNGAC